MGGSPWGGPPGSGCRDLLALVLWQPLTHCSSLEQGTIVGCQSEGKWEGGLARSRAQKGAGVSGKGRGLVAAASGVLTISTPGPG